MATSFVRSLGAESGVQLNPLQDRTETPTVDNYDQNIAIMCRLTRGRIDKPFAVNRSNAYSKLGKGEAMRMSALNEAWVHIIEALNKGCYEMIVQRLVTSAAVIKYAVARMGVGAVLTPVAAAGVVTSVTVTAGGTGYVTGQALTFTGDGTGALATITAVAGVITAVTVSAGGNGYTVAPTATAGNPISWAVETSIPAVPYLLAIKHNECFNDGIQCEIHAEENRVGGVNAANSVVRLVVKDIDGGVLHDFIGSLDPLAKDDYQNSFYLADIVEAQTTALEVTVGATITSIPVASLAYGYAVSGLPSWSKSGVLVCFDEGGTGYVTSNYSAARVKLQNTNLNYGYISSGGSQSPAVIAQLVQLAFDTNRIFAFDVSGSFNKEAAIAFYEQLNIGGNYESSDLCPAYWSPLKLTDPTGINGKTIIGRATLMLAYACRRNAVKNARGYCEDKRMPVAGRDYPLYNQGITQLVQISNFDKNDLAKAHINPVIGETYTGGFRYVFFDSLTGAAVSNSKRKLFSVIDMSVDVSERITRYSKDLLQKDIATTVRRMTDFLHQMRSDLYAAGWVVDPSETNPSFATDYFAYSVVPHAYLVDRVEVTIYPCFVGTTRQIALTPILV